jgi:uncharacterized protein
MAELEELSLDNMHRAKGFWQRLRGLMFFKSYPYDKPLLFEHCSSIHTFFMRFPIDVVFLDKDRRFIKTCKQVKPWRVCICFGSYYVIEMPAGRDLDIYKLQ